MSAILDELNNEQLAAVKCVDGPVLIVAGAGSGKTRVLTSRIAYTIENEIIDKSDRITLSFLSDKYNEAKKIFGTLSGRDIDKFNKIIY